MKPMEELKLSFRYAHGNADDGRLNLYDASVALGGISRAIAIITHAYLNGEVCKRADYAKGAQFYIETPKRGSFVYETIIDMAASAIASGLFYEFVKHVFTEAIGKTNQTDFLAEMLKDRTEPTLGELPASLENPLQHMLRPIKTNKDITLTVNDPVDNVLIYLDQEATRYLNPVTKPYPYPVMGYVTKYNVLSGWGKFFDIATGGPISFKLNANLPDKERSLITWSLHEHNVEHSGQLALGVRAVITPNGKIKRYLVQKVEKAPIR